MAQKHYVVYQIASEVLDPETGRVLTAYEMHTERIVCMDPKVGLLLLFTKELGQSKLDRRLASLGLSISAPAERGPGRYETKHRLVGGLVAHNVFEAIQIRQPATG